MSSRQSAACLAAQKSGSVRKEGHPGSGDSPNVRMLVVAGKSGEVSVLSGAEDFPSRDIREGVRSSPGDLEVLAPVALVLALGLSVSDAAVCASPAAS